MQPRLAEQDVEHIAAFEDLEGRKCAHPAD
jgi:hypothetical protein